MRRMMLLLAAGGLATTGLANEVLASPNNPPDGRGADFELFSCRLKSGASLQLRALQDAQGNMRVVLIQQRPARQRVLKGVEASYHGFAHGGDAIVQAHTENSTIDLFVQQGGVEPSFGALLEASAKGSTKQVCEPETINTPSSVVGDPNAHEAPLSLFSLGLRHIAGTLADPPDWPEEQ